MTDHARLSAGNAEARELGRLVVEETIALQKENALLKEGLKKLVRAAYSEGFSEGMREHSTSSGGKPWRESKICQTLTEIVGVQQ